VLKIRGLGKILKILILRNEVPGWGQVVWYVLESVAL
jgi:hypothetical protein